MHPYKPSKFLKAEFRISRQGVKRRLFSNTLKSFKHGLMAYSASAQTLQPVPNEKNRTEQNIKRSIHPIVNPTALSVLFKVRLSTIENHMGATEPSNFIKLSLSHASPQSPLRLSAFFNSSSLSAVSFVRL